LVTFYNAAGTRLTETTLNALADTVTTLEIVEFTADVYQSFTQDGGGFEDASRLVFVTGQRVPQSMIDGLFETATIDSITPETGPETGGTPIVIKGTDFSGAAGVTVGGVAATSFVVVDNETITATTPAGLVGARDVIVTDDAGNVTETGGFTYTEVAATVTDIDPTTGAAAGGTAVTITGTNLTHATGVTFGGGAATSFVVINTTTITCVTPAHAAGVVNVVVLDSGGNITTVGGFTYT
jgi:hypothetical protein